VVIILIIEDKERGLKRVESEKNDVKKELEKEHNKLQCCGCARGFMWW
jgi:hypothetical protein